MKTNKTHAIVVYREDGSPGAVSKNLTIQECEKIIEVFRAVGNGEYPRHLSIIPEMTANRFRNEIHARKEN